MKKVFILLLFTFIYSSIHAQNEALIIGKWIFKDAYNKENIDRAGLALLETKIISKMTFDFKDNGSFKAYMMGENKNGKWKLSSDQKRLTLKIPQEASVKLDILKLTKNQLALKLGLGEFLWLKVENKKITYIPTIKNKKPL